VIGIDIGGANLKVVDERGAAIHYCPLWQGAPIADLLSPYANREAAVVMSGELADCFRSKGEGISFIVDQVRKIFPKARFYGTDGCFHDGPDASLAAANWLASADWVRQTLPDAVLVDIGSTTTDIIPLDDFQTLIGLTDLRRLQKGLLLYTGMLRTTLQAIVRSVEVNGIPTPVSSEHFAQSGDVHLVLGHITPAEYTCDTPDRGLRSVEGALRRIARVVCCDLDEIGEPGARSIAQQCWEAQRDEVVRAVRRIAQDKRPVAIAGIGASIFASAIKGQSLSSVIGTDTEALPAAAVRELALNTDRR
jgi:probable H4MPT-linked C1 transfer pathway protein